MLTFNQFQLANEERCKTSFGHSLDSWSLMEWGAATAGEIGEACNKAKKIKRHMQNIKGNKPDETLAGLRNSMAKEIADSIVYSFLWLSTAGYNVEDIVKEVFNTKSDEIGSDIKV